MKDLSEKTREILRAAGITNLYNYRLVSAYGIMLSIAITLGRCEYSMADIYHAADEIEKALQEQ